MEKEKINGFSIDELERGTWTSKDRVQKYYMDITQQHWSNIYWYHCYLSQKDTEKIVSIEKDLELIKAGKVPEYSGIKTFFEKYGLHIMNDAVLGILEDGIERIKKDVFQYNRMSNFGLAQLIYRFDGKILDWQPQYENEKEWYREQCTRKILVEKCK
jgi:hypothetical protein